MRAGSFTSEALPNDAIAVPADAPNEFTSRVQKILMDITVEEAKALLPAHYTGFAAATHDTYEPIVKAGIAVGKITPRG